MRKNLITTLIVLLIQIVWLPVVFGAVIYTGEVKLSGLQVDEKGYTVLSVKGNVEYYNEKDSVLRGLRASLEGRTSDPDIHNRVDFVHSKGQDPYVSLREAFIDLSFGVNVRVGKQTFESENINYVNFSSVGLSPFVGWDQSVYPYRMLGEDPIGQWGASIKLFESRLELIGMAANMSYLAIDPDNPNTRSLPLSVLGYSDPEQERNYSVGLRWMDEIGNIAYNFFAQRGHANAVVDVDVDMMTREVTPLFAEQTSAGFSLRTDILGWTVKGGIAGYFPDNYRNFTLGVIECEKIFQNVFASGDSFVLELGLSDVERHGTGKEGEPGLDYRRITEGLTLMGGLNWTSPEEAWEARLEGAHNRELNGRYASLEISFSPAECDWELSLIGTYHDGDDQGIPKAVTNAWAAIEGPMIGASFIWYF